MLQSTRLDNIFSIELPLLCLADCQSNRVVCLSSTPSSPAQLNFKVWAKTPKSGLGSLCRVEKHPTVFWTLRSPIDFAAYTSSHYSNEKCSHSNAFTALDCKRCLCILAMELPVISARVTQLNPQATFGKWLIFKGGLEENTSYTIFHVTLSVLNSEKYGIIGGKYMIHWVSVFPPN